MGKIGYKAVLIAVIIMFVAAPGLAQDESGDEINEPEDDFDIEQNENEEQEIEDDSNIDGTDNSTEMTVTKEEAETTARGELSEYNWTLEETKVKEEDGYYEFEFVSGENEAEVRVDGSSGKVFRYEEEIEEEKSENETIDNLEDAKNLIEDLRNKIEELKEENQRLREKMGEGSQNNEELPEEASEQAREARNRQGPPEDKGPQESETELETQEEDTEIEAEQETEEGRTETDVEVEENGKEAEIKREGPAENSNRPKFVNEILKGIFG